VGAKNVEQGCAGDQLHVAGRVHGEVGVSGVQDFAGGHIDGVNSDFGGADFRAGQRGVDGGVEFVEGFAGVALEVAGNFCLFVDWLRVVGGRGAGQLFLGGGRQGEAKAQGGGAEQKAERGET